MVRKLLLWCGVLAALLYVGSDIMAAMRWEGYSYAARSVSELRAIGAPTRSFLVPILFVYAGLELAFGYGVWASAGQRRALRVAGALVMALAVVDLVIAPFFPMQLGAEMSALTNTMHLILTAVTVLLILLVIGFGASADGKWFVVYSVLTILTLIVAGVWAGMDAPRIDAQLPTPWLGVRERINIYGYMLWMIVLAGVLLRAKARHAQGGSGNRPPTPQRPARGHAPAPS